MKDISLGEFLCCRHKMNYHRVGRIVGLFYPEGNRFATDFLSYEEGNLLFVSLFTWLNGGQIRIYTNTYCLGQKTLSGKISEAYKWEERLSLHGVSSELIKKISEFLQRAET